MFPHEFASATYNPASPAVVQFYDPVTGTLSYVVADLNTRDAAIIDPVLDYDLNTSKVSTGNVSEILAFVKLHGLKLNYILETHAHADHLSAAYHIKSTVGGQISIGDGIKAVQKHFVPYYNLPYTSDGSQFDLLWKDGDTFKIGSYEGRVLGTPGHTSDSNTFVIGDAAFVGDTLFAPDVGTARCDFPGGNAEVLYDSIQKIFSLPENTKLFLCHDYPPAGADGKARPWLAETSIQEQKNGNIHLRNGATKEQFVKMRSERDAKLAAPRLLLPSIQVNINAGRFPEPENNGTSYLKLPVKGI